MRFVPMLAPAILVLGLVGPAWGQSTISFGGPVPQVQNVIIPYPGVQHTLFSLQDPNLPIAQPQFVGNRRFSLSSYLPRLTPRNNRTIIGFTPFPTGNQLPNVNYFRPFRLARPGPIIPR
jgi:hypothetical protein